MEAGSKKYLAFISYSHRDKAWGDWLHKGLEHYKIPKSLVGIKTPRGEAVPARIFPVFRDREELPTAVDLGAIINGALEQSRYLIVICSPASARSQWVNQEILNYKKLGHENRVLAIIVDGEPNAADRKPGFTSDQECFPPALKFKIGADGNLSDHRTEPIAADARPHADGKANALLKLVAGVLGVNYDELERRDEVQRRHRQRVAMATISFIALIIGGLAVAVLIQQKVVVEQTELADERGNEAKLQRDEALAQQGRNYLNQSRARFAAFQLTEANTLPTRALGNVEVGPGDSRPLLKPGSADLQAAMLLKRATDGVLLYQKSRDPFHNFGLSTDFRFGPSVCHDPKNHRLFGAEESILHGYDLHHGTQIWTAPLPAEGLVFLTVSSDGKTLVAMHGKGLTTLEAASGKILRNVAMNTRQVVGTLALFGDTLVAGLRAEALAININPLFPPSGPTQSLFQGSQAESKFLPAKFLEASHTFRVPSDTAAQFLCLTVMPRP